MSTNTGFRVEGSYRNVNFLHRAWELSTGLRFEQKRQLAYADIGASVATHLGVAPQGPGRSFL